jgi:hypothetical protein
MAERELSRAAARRLTIIASIVPVSHSAKL